MDMTQRKLLALILCGLFCLPFFTACKQDTKPADTTVPQSAKDPAPQKVLSPDELYTALLTTGKYQLIAYTKQTNPSKSSEIIMTRKVLNRDDNRLFTQTETFDGTDAARTTIYADMDTNRTFEMNNLQQWEFRRSAAPIVLEEILQYSLDVSSIFPWTELLKSENYDSSDPDSRERSMSEAALKGWLDAKEPSVSYVYDHKTKSYTVSATAIISKLKYSLTLQISFLPLEVVLPDPEGREAYPTPIPSNLYNRMANDTHMEMHISGNGYDYALLHDGQKVMIDLISHEKTYYYHTFLHKFYVKTSGGWVTKDTNRVGMVSTSFEGILNRLKIRKNLSIFEPANYNLPSPSDTELVMSKEALEANGLSACSYTYDKLLREYRFSITPTGCDQPYLLRIRLYYNESVSIPSGTDSSVTYMTVKRMYQEMSGGRKYRITTTDENGSPIYTLEYATSGIYKLIHHPTDEVRYYDYSDNFTDSSIKYVYTFTDGKWVRTVDKASNGKPTPLKIIGAGESYLYEDDRFSQLEISPDGAFYRCVSLPKGIESIRVQCDWQSYEYEIVPVGKAPYHIRIEFFNDSQNDIFIELPEISD